MQGISERPDVFAFSKMTMEAKSLGNFQGKRYKDSGVPRILFEILSQGGQRVNYIFDKTK